jgi:hypothetical protein
MADKASLKRIGWAFGALTAAVMVLAALIVHNATAGKTPTGTNEGATQVAAAFSTTR